MRAQGPDLPRGVVGDTVDWLTDGAHWRGDDGVPALLVQHLQVTAVAVLVATAVALPIGIVLGHARRGGAVVTAVGNLTRAVPTFGLLVLLTAGPLGFSYSTQVVALAVFAVSPLLTNTYAGVAGVDRDAVEAATGLGMSGRQLVARVELPLALPLIATGLRTAAVQTVATATLVAFVGGGGLGLVLNLGFGQGPAGRGAVIAGAVLVASLALITELLLGRLQVAVTPGPRRKVRPGATAGKASTGPAAPGFAPGRV